MWLSVTFGFGNRILSAISRAPQGAHRLKCKKLPPNLSKTIRFSSLTDYPCRLDIPSSQTTICSAIWRALPSPSSVKLQDLLNPCKSERLKISLITVAWVGKWKLEQEAERWTFWFALNLNIFPSIDDEINCKMISSNFKVKF